MELGDQIRNPVAWHLGERKSGTHRIEGCVGVEGGEQGLPLPEFEPQLPDRPLGSVVTVLTELSRPQHRYRFWLMLTFHIVYSAGAGIP